MTDNRTELKDRCLHIEGVGLDISQSRSNAVSASTKVGQGSL